MRRTIFAAVLLTALLLPASSMHVAASTRWVDDLTTGTSTFLNGTGTLILAEDAPAAPDYMGTFAHSGSYLSSEHAYDHPVAAVVVAADAALPAGALVRIDVRGRTSNGAWQLWNEAPLGQRVAFDRPTTTVQFRLTLLANGASPAVRSVSVDAEGSDQALGALNNDTAPTYRIYATREGLVGHRTANGHIITNRDYFVALPSWRSLSSLGGGEYKVRLSYRGRSIVVPVWDVGPWNTHDDYWSTNRQMWKDLPRGLPEAQAAYQNGYNGGRDEFGRRPNLPNGIDIADGAFWDGLGLTDHAWVDVTFLWEGTDPGGSAEPAPPVEEPAPPPPPPPPPPAAPDGALVVDNSAAGFTAVSGTWFDGTCGIGDSHTWTYTAPTQARAENVGVWNTPISKAGFYEVFAFVPACGKPATHAAQYAVNHEGGLTPVTLDQEAHQNLWNSLGTFYFKPGSGNAVSLTDLTGESGLSVRYDGLAWVPRADTTAPTAEIAGIKNIGAGRYAVTWRGNDDASGIASFDVQVQRNGGDWRDWQPATSAMQATFLVEDASPAVYGFRVRAHDWAGNVSQYPATAQMTTAQATK